MKKEIFLINTLSNLHVGSGEINYGLVDNLIQRDPVTNLPTINSSSLKGALREHFEKIYPGKINVKQIFGSEPKENDAKQRKQGSVRFFEADLLSLPVRTSGTNFPFVNVLAKEQLSSIRTRLELLDINTPFLPDIENLPEQQNNNESVQIEDLVNEKGELRSFRYATTKQFKNYIGDRISIVSNSQLGQLCDNEHLPVISRNCLEDGQSENLFYEQVLPRYTRLCTIMMSNDDSFDDFCNHLNNQIVQVGGNATIGYGYCKFTKYSL